MAVRGLAARRTVVVVGSGAAGLTAAIEASARHDVVLLTKGPLGESNTLYAQGGIAAAMFPDDSTEAHLDDTLLAGAGACDERSARILCESGPAGIRRLLELGVPFDRDGSGLARGREAAHSAARIVHAGGDATGRAVVSGLIAALRGTTVRVLEHAFLRDIVIRHGRVRGVSVLLDGRAVTIAADDVIIATGGAGQLFRHTTNPAGATGDGIAAAVRAGAALVDAEYFQFHPTALAVAGTPLISEAVRGDGAVLLDSNGHRFMPEFHPDAELAPRDVVARAIAARMEAQGGEAVLLDATGLGRARLAERFPGFWALCARNGLDPSQRPVPVTPAAHYWMGGIEVDDEGRSRVPGLFAVGEAACTGAHGANRLASNSLLEALVFGRRAAAAIGVEWPWPPVERAPVEARGSTPIARERLRALLWRHAGLVRDAEGLAAASEVLGRAVVTGQGVAELETANLLQLGRALVAAAAARSESLGAHHRADDPSSNPDPVPTMREAALAC